MSLTAPETELEMQGQVLKIWMELSGQLLSDFEACEMIAKFQSLIIFERVSIYTELFLTNLALFEISLSQLPNEARIVKTGSIEIDITSNTKTMIEISY